jgi:hypothetical protein
MNRGCPAAAWNVASARDFDRLLKRLGRQIGAVQLEEGIADVAVVNPQTRAVDRVRNRRRETVVMFERPGGRVRLHRQERGSGIEKKGDEGEAWSQRNHLSGLSALLYRGGSRGQSVPLQQKPISLLDATCQVPSHE